MLSVDAMASLKEAKTVGRLECATAVLRADDWAVEKAAATVLLMVGLTVVEMVVEMVDEMVDD